MIFQTYNLDINSTRREKFISITKPVREFLRQSEIQEGCCKICVPHTTAGITINESADPDVVHDILKHLSTMVPNSREFLHSEGNRDAHIKSTLVGCSVEIPVQEGALAFGQWQGIFFCEFDGPGHRKVIVQFFGSE